MKTRARRRSKMLRCALACTYVAEALEGRRLLTFSPIGPEFSVNQTTGGQQLTAAIAADADGDFVVAWASQGNTAPGPNQDASGYGVYARRYNAAGAALGDEFRVNTFTPGDQTAPAVAIDADGDFVVVWASRDQDGSLNGVYGQRYDAAGSARGGEFRVNTHTANYQRLPSMAMDVDGDFVVAWESGSQDGSGNGIYARRYAADGTPRSGEFPVNSTTAGNQSVPSAATDAQGNFVIAWGSNVPREDGGGYGVYSKRYTAAGAERVPPPGVPLGLGNEFRVNTTTATDQKLAVVAMDYAGDFVIAWTSNAPEADFGVAAQRFTAAGALAGGEFRVNDTPGGVQRLPAVAMDADGDFAVSWISYNQEPAPGSGAGVFAKRYSAAGAGTAEVQVNTFTPSAQNDTAVAMDADGDAMFAWQSFVQDAADGYGIYAQRYDQSGDTAGPIVTGVVAAGDRLDPGERLASAVPSIAIQFSENLSLAGGATGANSATNPASYHLTRDGNDVSSLITSVSFALNAATRKYEAVLNLSAPLPDGAIVLTARQVLRDPAGNAFDGNLDGVPGGGDYTLPFAVRGVVRVGPEFRVNAFTADAQRSSAVGMDADGDFVTTWQSYGQDGSSNGVYARRFNAAGVAQQAPGEPAGVTEFRVNTFTAGGQESPAVGMDADGDFVIAWQSYGQDGSSYGVYARRFNAAGVAQGAPGEPAGVTEFRVNTFTAGGQESPAVGMDADGDFVVTWNSFGQDGSSYGVYARRFNAAGVAQQAPGEPAGVTEFRVNTFTAGRQESPAVGMDADGDFVVAWISGAQDGSKYGVYARRFNAAGVAQQAPGEPAGVTEFRVNTFTADSQVSHAVGMDADGDFVIAWQSYGQDGSSNGVYARRFNAAGVAQQAPGEFGGVTEFRVNTFTAGRQESPAVGMDADGDFVIAWQSYGQDGSSYGVYARRFNAAGVAQQAPGEPAGVTEFRVNTFTAGRQQSPAVGMDADGDFVVTWQSLSQDGSSYGVYAQRYGPNQPPTTLGIPGVTVQQDEANTVLSLWDAFDDPNTPEDTLTFSVVGNTNPGLFSSTAVSNAAGTLTLDYAPGQSGQSTITVRATDPGGLSVDTSFLVNVGSTDAVAPVVNNVTINGGAAQRSNVSTLGIRFSEAVNIPTLIANGTIDTHIRLFAKANPGTPLPWLNETRFQWNGGTNTLSIDLTTDGFGGSAATNLANGRYQLRLAVSAITDVAGNALADNDGVANGTLIVDRSTGAASQNFFRLGGDLDGDADVDLSDLGGLATFFGTGSAGGDCDGDGDTDLSDLGLLASNFQTNLPLARQSFVDADPIAPNDARIRRIRSGYLAKG